MADDLYFSEREEGVPHPDKPETSPEFWAGFVALVGRLIAEGSLAEKFPRTDCPDIREGITSCDSDLVGCAFRGQNPGIAWPLRSDNPPLTLLALDATEFFFPYVSTPQTRLRHESFAHYHLMDFNPYSAQQDYCKEVNRLLRRNRHPYAIDASGRLSRTAPPVLMEALSKSVFRTGDEYLDKLLEVGREKFGSPDAVARKEALEKLWDAWERLKTLEDSDKKTGTEKLLLRAIPEPMLRERIDKEARALTDIGNDFVIRHTERDKTPIDREEHVDYLFHRMFALMWLLLRCTGRLG